MNDDDEEWERQWARWRRQTLIYGPLLGLAAGALAILAIALSPR